MQDRTLVKEVQMQDRYLFRGKRIDTGDWEFGDLEHYNEQVLIKVFAEEFGDPVYSVPVNPDTVGQYTGLKDKAGEMIFEGDLVTVTGYSYIEPETEKSGEICITPLGCVLLDVETRRHINLYDLQGSYTTVYEKYGNIHDKEAEDEN